MSVSSKPVLQIIFGVSEWLDCLINLIPIIMVAIIMLNYRETTPILTCANVDVLFR